ncbi:proline-rich protein PRCC [Drosophila sechellia]|uniref:GM14192 n=1 Tax=Drosophila sechellia TaxID=7238 RepID=B4HVX0_DROSE|nr:proline-rich protein PRCC [Drosophila sechellia]EDW50085.1 GM14192 [Drosophila sechellia]
MSLVAYAASSDEDSENEEENSLPQVEIIKPQAKPSTPNAPNEASLAPESASGHISDEDDDYVLQEVSLQELKPPNGRLLLALPKPKVTAPAEDLENEDVDHQVTSAFANLPMPRTAAKGKAIVEEKDDEFLHKKALPVEIEKPPPPPVKGKVKISIPSLRDFSDVDQEKADRAKNKVNKPNAPKGSGLLSLLPQAKSERNFSKNSSSAAGSPSASNTLAPSPNNNPAQSRAAPAFVPDTVKHRRAAHNTEGVDGPKASHKKNPEAKDALKPTKSKPISKPTSLVNASDSEDDDEDGTGDYFSLNSEQKLPEVSSNEISALVAKRAAKMVEASSKYLEEVAEKEAAEAEAARLEEEQTQIAQMRYHEQQLNAEAMDALVGKNAKRRRKEAKEMQVIDISGSQVLPDREEWMRSALASSTTFQPTGVLTDEEPVAGTRRKHQITYLAHKAKANEAELQAMWSANRQTRRATQSKYGF